MHVYIVSMMRFSVLVADERRILKVIYVFSCSLFVFRQSIFVGINTYIVSVHLFIYTCIHFVDDVLLRLGGRRAAHSRGTLSYIDSGLTRYIYMYVYLCIYIWYLYVYMFSLSTRCVSAF